ncbi:pentatricopeptide repeat-containing protein At5g14080 [Rhododendron vialii]|uniref:pentatricopeptide repeat-containing protein At5g14080 n=1 Tax=Rhododendron vialii TaxID=182163 RepID=UPI00265FD53E|nr:pentatricopeptide repeat-containing protein At5g14080 [Rhododendron vialii]XP_058185987.1 pentatricopeptide repeat-containing protein At5g14080 [Rhododendron vialii]XP_058185988.1 pentatricopeptide repeat-containing protein At5g14080 [Rhododendron vialii]XP_058185989.1 pentatricopeptide repeat-containing protein At5g14080 [Rhododendron vialii]XP_058185990.1 pentatricopeptide repeat-containing protein At5g14080 [Rhododendron vialii]XP_058185991.1 pentatricopeptide repeat-containing protein A
MTSPMIHFANQISQALISASKRSLAPRKWTPSLEQTLHRLGCRDSLTPSLVARVIDPFLLNHHALALGFFDWASQQPGFSHTSTTYQSILKSLSISRRHFNAIDKLLNQVRAQKIGIDPSVYSSIIASLIRGKRTRDALTIFNEVSYEVSYGLGSGVCNSLLAVLSSDGYMGDARKVFDVMVVRGVSMSTVGFGVYVWRFCRNVEVCETLSLLDEVRKGVSGVNGSIIAVLIIHGLCLESRVADALWVMDELRNRDCKPDFMAYRIVAEAFRLMGSVVDVEVVLKKKRKLGVAPRVNEYREFIFALISEGRIWEAKELGEVIVSGNFPIEDDVLVALIRSISINYPCSAMLFFKFMVGKERVPTLLTLSNLSRNLFRHDKIDELLEVFQILSTKEYFSDMASYNVRVSFLCKAGRVKEAYEVLQEMKKKGLCPDVSFYNYLMEACCREDLLRPAKRLWDEMFASGCGGNLKTYNILISKFSKTGQAEEAHRLFCHMLEKGLVPNAMTYTFLLEGLCKEKRVKDALEVFDKSVKQDAMLAQNLLTTFVLYLCKEGHFHAASRLLCGIISDVGQSDSHVILLKCLLEAAEIPVAIEHITSVGKNSASMLPAICNKLVASVSSLSKAKPLLQLLQSMQERCPNSERLN